MNECQTQHWRQNARYKRAHTVLVQVYKVQTESKLNYGATSQDREGGQATRWNGAHGGFGEAGNIDLSNRCMGDCFVKICQATN